MAKILNDNIPVNDITIKQSFYDDNKLMSIFQSQVNEDGDLIVFNKYFYKSGKLMFLGWTKNNLPNGLSITFYENGQTKELCNWKMGVENELWESWYENGQMKFRCNYKNGKINGLWETWDESGRLKDRENYKNGKLIKQ